jgi:hypothetical protein
MSRGGVLPATGGAPGLAAPKKNKEKTRRDFLWVVLAIMVHVDLVEL